MLERVGVGQVRFTVPGLSVDGRGAVMGRQMVVRFPSLDRLVTFLRLWSGEQALDDVQPGLRLMQARASGGPRDALARFTVVSASLVEPIARAARLAGGHCFTGAGKHFVQVRDAQAPLGYDASALEPAPDDVDMILYGADRTWSYVVEREIPFETLLLQLDLQRGDEGAPMRDVLFLAVRRGLGPVVIDYLHRAQRRHPTFRISVALCETRSDAAFRHEPPFWLMRLADLPPRLLGLLSGTPGLTLFTPIVDNVAVAIGYRHPIHLGACRQALPAERLFLFSPAPRGVSVVDPAPVFLPIGDLVRLSGRGALPVEVAGHGFQPAAAEALAIPLRIEPAPVATSRASAALVPWEQVGWLRSLCYALPASALRNHRLAVLERGVLVVAPDALSGIPFGQLLHSPGPGLLVPLGWEIRPRVSPVELAASAGATGGTLVVFPGPELAPFRIPADSISTLQAFALGEHPLPDLAVERGRVAARPAGAPDVGVEIENRPLGPMPLWGLPK
ncbi:MAG TPA: hypothetical protein VGP07_03585 [Polyangia bacterium]|jgi:hypothetical protein